MRYSNSVMNTTGFELVDKQYQNVADLAAEIMTIDTHEALEKTSALLYQFIEVDETEAEQWHFQSTQGGSELMITRPQLLDKLIELSYKIHRKKQHNRRRPLGYFMLPWVEQATRKDEQDFELYLKNLEV